MDIPVQLAQQCPQATTEELLNGIVLYSTRDAIWKQVRMFVCEDCMVTWTTVQPLSQQGSTCRLCGAEVAGRAWTVQEMGALAKRDTVPQETEDLFGA